MYIETKDEFQESKANTGNETVRDEREFVKLDVYNNFQQDAPKSVTLHNCVLDGYGALRFYKETNPKYKDKMFLFVDVFDTDGEITKIILKENWGKEDAYGKGTGSPAGSELRKVLLEDANETENPRIKEAFLFRPFWIEKFAAKSANGGVYHNVMVGFEENAEIPDDWVPFMCKEDGLTWADVKDDPIGYLNQKLAAYRDANNSTPESEDNAKPDGEDDWHEYARERIKAGDAITAVANELDKVFGMGSHKALEIAAEEYRNR